MSNDTIPAEQGMAGADQAHAPEHAAAGATATPHDGMGVQELRLPQQYSGADSLVRRLWVAAVKKGVNRSSSRG